MRREFRDASHLRFDGARVWTANLASGQVDREVRLRESAAIVQWKGLAVDAGPGRAPLVNMLILA